MTTLSVTLAKFAALYRTALGLTPIATSSPGTGITNVNGTLNIDVNAVAAAVAALGTQAQPVQQLIDASLAVQAQSFNRQLSATNALVGTGPYQVGTQTYATIPQALAATSQTAGGGSAPTITAAPSISPITVSVTQANIAVTAGTSTGGTNVTRSYRWIVAGIAQASIWQPVSGAAQAISVGGGVATASAQTVVLEELVSYTGSAVPISNKSINYTLSAGAAVPLNTAKPSFSGTAAPGATLSLLSGSWSNTPTSYDYTVYDGDPAAGGVLINQQLAQAGTGVTLTLTAGVYNGKTLYLSVVARNAAGPSVETFALQPVLVSGGIAPAQIAPIGIGYAASYPVATPIQLDYQGPEFWANTPGATGYLVTTYRDNVVSSGPTANLTSYTPVAADQDKTFSYTVTASNGGGISAPAVYAGQPIVAQVGGGGGGGAVTTSFVGATANGANAVNSLGIAVGNISPSVQTNDALLHIRSNNGGVAWSGTPSGFSTQLNTSFTLTGNGKQVDAYVKTATGSEPAAYTSTPTSPPQILGMVLAAWRRSDGTAASWLANAQGTPNNSANASGSTVTFPTVTSSSPAAGQRHVLVLVLDPSAGESTTFSNLPSGYTLVGSLDFTGSGINWQPIYIFEGAAPSAGATGAKTMTVTTSAGTFGYGTYSFIVG